MDFAAAPSRGQWTGLAFLTGTLTVEAGLLALILRLGPGPAAALVLLLAIAGLPVVAWLVYGLWGSLSLRYRLGRDGIIIRWAADSQIVPMTAITHVLGGRAYTSPLRGFRWPGHEIGRTEVATDDGQTRETLVYASAAPRNQLLIVTADLAYAISPADRAAFIAEFRMRQRLGPVQDLRQETARPVWARLTLWSDGVALRLIGVSGMLVALASAWLMWHYPGMPAQMVLQPVPGITGPAADNLLRPRVLIWGLPAIGLATIGANVIVAAAVHRHARLAALLLVAATLVFQLALWVVVLRLA